MRAVREAGGTGHQDKQTKSVLIQHAGGLENTGKQEVIGLGDWRVRLGTVGGDGDAAGSVFISQRRR